MIASSEETTMNTPPETKKKESRFSPGTDPTNRYRQEAVGVFVPNEQSNERRQDEPGLTDRDRQQRDATPA